MLCYVLYFQLLLNCTRGGVCVNSCNLYLDFGRVHPQKLLIKCSSKENSGYDGITFAAKNRES